MAATEFEFKAVEKIISSVARANKPVKKNGYTRREILQKESFKNAIRACKKKDFTDDEIMQVVNAAIKNSGLEEKGLHFSKKEILALLEMHDEENNATKNKKQDAPNTASFDEGETKDGESE